MLAILVGIIIFGGIQSISKVATKVVPFMAVLYILICSTLLVSNFDKISETFILNNKKCIYNHSCYWWIFRCYKYRMIFVIMVLLGGFLKLELVWIIADIVMD
ncbi:alanine:cation symporter family protein [Metaclostridioides mangenotii]|uniref:alanine:cation symporter family protein n=1 Tax=Metaclostridioides mangenotii TaxID=1540 RepID=UPI00047F4C27